MPFPITPTADLKLSYTRDRLNRVYVVDLVLSPDGDLRLVSGLDRLEQDVRRWLQVGLGHYVFDVTWGDPLWAERGRPQPASVVDLIRAAMHEAENNFIRAQTQAAEEGYLSTDEQLDHFEDVRILTYDGDPGRFDVIFRIVARSGNDRDADIWVTADNTPGGLTYAPPPVLALTAAPAAVRPSETSELHLFYDGGGSIVVRVCEGPGSLLLTYDDLTTTDHPSFIALDGGVVDTYPGEGGGHLVYIAPSDVLSPSHATVCAVASDAQSTQIAEASVQITLIPAPAITLAFAEPAVLISGEVELLVTYTGQGVLTLSVDAGSLPEGQDKVIGTGELLSYAIVYSAPAEVPDPAMVTAIATDGLSTAYATVTVRLGLGGSMSGAARSSIAVSGSMAGTGHTAVTSGSVSGGAAHEE